MHQQLRMRADCGSLMAMVHPPTMADRLWRPPFAKAMGDGFDSLVLGSCMSFSERRLLAPPLSDVRPQRVTWSPYPRKAAVDRDNGSGSYERMAAVRQAPMRLALKPHTRN